MLALALTRALLSLGRPAISQRSVGLLPFVDVTMVQCSLLVEG